MKQHLAFFVTSLCLAGCVTVNNEQPDQVILQDTTHCNMPCEHHLNTDSIANVSDLLDSLDAYEPKVDTVQ